MNTELFKMNVTHSCETLGTTYPVVQGHLPEDQTLQFLSAFPVFCLKGKSNSDSLHTLENAI